jgi:hypothetical protein
MVNGTADIDGATQNISGRACKQPDGTWQIQQQDTGVDMGDVPAAPVSLLLTIHITTRGFMGHLWRSSSARRSSSSIVFITSIIWIMSTSDRTAASAAAFMEGKASLEEAVFTEAAGGTVSPWLHARGWYEFESLTG